MVVIRRADEGGGAFSLPATFEATDASCTGDDGATSADANVDCDATADPVNDPGAGAAQGSQYANLDADTASATQSIIYDGVIDPACSNGTLTFSLALNTAEAANNYGGPTVIFRASGSDVLPRIELRSTGGAARVICPDGTTIGTRSSSHGIGEWIDPWSFTIDQANGDASFVGSTGNGSSCDSATVGTDVDGFRVYAYVGDNVIADNFDFTCLD